MATIEEDTFDSDSGLWTVDVTNGSSALVGGARTLAKTVNGWNQTGFFSQVKAVTYGDTVEIQFQFDDFTTNNTYLYVAYRNLASPVLTNAGLVGCYVYPDGGKTIAHGHNSGVGVASNPSEGMAGSTVYTVQFYITDPEGHLEVKIKGGAWGETYQDLVIDSAGSTNINIVTAHTNKYFLLHPYSTQSDNSTLNYVWYDKNGLSVSSTKKTSFKKFIQQAIG